MTKSKKKNEMKTPKKVVSESTKESLTRTLAEQLHEHYDEAEWGWIKPHTERGIVIAVDAFLDVLQVGEAIARDQSVEVQKWINQNLLTKPTLQQIADWDSKPTNRFLCLIVKPYVLIQDLQNSKVKH